MNCSECGEIFTKREKSHKKTYGNKRSDLRRINEKRKRREKTKKMGSASYLIQDVMEKRVQKAYVSHCYICQSTKLPSQHHLGYLPGEKTNPVALKKAVAKNPGRFVSLCRLCNLLIEWI